MDIEVVRGEASTKILGYKYQEMVALLKCLEAKEHTSIYIECYGDVSDGDTSTEIKHSIDEDKTLIDTHIDFWKTLGNIVENLEVYKAHSQFILHTTAQIKKGSIFENWDTIDENQKKNLVLGVASNATIKDHHDKVVACNSDKLKSILSKLKILHSQKSAKLFYKDELVGNILITKSTEEKNREAIVERLLGFISSILIKSENNNYLWEISIDEFNKIFQTELKKYQISDLIFPVVNTILDDALDQQYKFTSELINIGYDTKVGSAMKDYLSAQESRIQMIKNRRNLAQDLDEYDSEISEKIVEVKIEHEDRLRSIDEKDFNEKSRRYYDDCQTKIESHLEIPGVIGIKRYYPKGRVHFNIENSNELTWQLNPVTK